MPEAKIKIPLPAQTGDGRPLTWVERVAGLGPLGLADATRKRVACGSPDEVLGPRELSYLRYKAFEYLASSRWQIRNAGVKLAGHLGLGETVSMLCDFLTSTTFRPWWKRLLSGVHKQVGFIRRNSATALSEIGAWDPAVRTALLTSVRDPYFEVRSASARAIGRLARKAGPDAEAEAALRALLADRCFEVAREAALALGWIAGDSPSVPSVIGLLEHPNWKVRDGALRALGQMIERGIVESGLVDRELRRLLVTSTDFRAIFPLKQSLHRLQHIIHDNLNRDE